jgi:bla regulator protein BlaR1
MIAHLWQSTLFAAVAALLTLLFRNNPARVRHWLWLAASLKFLIPFSLLVGLGSQVQWRSAAPPPLSHAMENISQTLSSFPAPAALPTATPVNWTLIGVVVWLSGCAFVLAAWSVRWQRIRKSVLDSEPFRIANVPIAVRSSPTLLEPGVFGIFRPILLLPENIHERLTPIQLDAIVAHELCHVRRRDNLAAAIHMLVEALFWFHPLVWWIGARLVEERERACDEEVLRLGNQPETYAESILNVCRLYLESPLACVSGVTGSDLKKRIEGIMADHVARKLDFSRKALLTAAAFAAISAPVVVGIWNAPPLRGQSAAQSTAQALPEERLTFEVASVKPAAKTDDRSMGLEFLAGGRLSVRDVPLLALVSTAYNLPFQGPRQPTGIPRELAMERYDIEAKAPADAFPPGATQIVREARMRRMLETLLEDRFQMKIRRETRDSAVYAVVVGKGGPKLTKAKIEEKDCPVTRDFAGPGCHSWSGGLGRGLHGDAVSVTDMTNAVSNWADRPVLDRTGIQGLFEINTEGWAPMLPRVRNPEEGKGDAGIDDSTRPSLYMIFERLGLKMESSKAPIDFYIVEHIERPTAN